MIKRFLPLLAVLILSGGVAQAEVNFGRYHALVIGINDYQHLPQLKTAVNDATAVADLMPSHPKVCYDRDRTPD